MNKAAATLVISAFLVVSVGTGLAQKPSTAVAAPQGGPAQTTAQNATARAGHPVAADWPVRPHARPAEGLRKPGSETKRYSYSKA
jgi:hypothetical protein